MYSGFLYCYKQEKGSFLDIRLRFPKLYVFVVQRIEVTDLTAGLLCRVQWYSKYCSKPSRSI